MTSIVLTTDLSPASARAFAPAAQLARDLHLPIHLVHVIVDARAFGANDGTGRPGSREVSIEVEAAGERLSEMAAEIGALVPGDPAGLEVHPRVLVGTELIETLDGYAKSVGARFVVCSTHGRTGLRHLVLGSVAESLVRHASLPVICCPERTG